MVSLYACVLHCLLFVSSHDTLNECAASIDTWETLVGHVEKIYTTYTDVDRVQELRERRISDERKRDADVKAAKGRRRRRPTRQTYHTFVKVTWSSRMPSCSSAMCY
jgi:hypothetical protein